MISFYFIKNSIFEKVRKTAKNEENQRKSLVFSALSIKTATHGGATRNRTGDEGFADLCLTAWLWRHEMKDERGRGEGEEPKQGREQV